MSQDLLDGEVAMRRAHGEGRIYRRGNIWWIQFRHNGERVFESSRSRNRDIAAQLLRKRLGEVAAGNLPLAGANRITYENLRDALLADYAANKRKWLRIGKDGKPYICGISTLDGFFKGCRAVNITTDSLRRFIGEQQKKGMANGTINRCLALLRRMLRLAIEDGKLRDVPHFPMLREASPRKGFLEHSSYQKLRQHLPEHLRPVLATGYYTGMRLGEILGLRWTNVDLANAEVRLDPDSTKNEEARTIPLTSELLEMLRIERERNPKAEFVFMREGERIGSFRKAWNSAAKCAGLPELLFHDLRRTGIRNLVRAGVPERVAMAISGHRTRAVFERYNIVSGRDLKEAARKLEVYLEADSSTDFGDSLATVTRKQRGHRSLNN